MRFPAAVLLSALFAGAASAAAVDAAAAAKRAEAEGTLQMDNWCARFKAGCVDKCMQGKVAGSVKVSVACKAAANAADFQFACKCDGKDNTPSVLSALGGLSTRTTTTGFKTKTVAETLRPTTLTTTTTSTSVSETTTTQTTSTPRITQTSTIQTTTTQVPIAPTTVVSVILSTQLYETVRTVTETSASIGGQPIATTLPIQLVEVVISPESATEVRRRAVREVFCRNYADSCVRECARVKSTVRSNVCRRTSTTLYSYKLGCVCNNGITETKHALAALQGSVDVLSTVGYVTSTQTFVELQTSVITETAVRTLSFTSTFVSLTTATDRESTTSVSTSVSTFTPRTTTTSTVSRASGTATATTTNLVILAPTGVLRARKVSDDAPFGFLKAGGGDSNILAANAASKADADKYMLVKDSSTGQPLYKLTRTDLSSSAVCEVPVENQNLASGSKNFCIMEGLKSLQTFTSPAVDTPTGYVFAGPHEAYFFKTVIGTIANQPIVKLMAQWVNTDGTRPITYLIAESVSKKLFATGDRLETKKTNNNLSTVPLYLTLE